MDSKNRVLMVMEIDSSAIKNKANDSITNILIKNNFLKRHNKRQMGGLMEEYKVDEKMVDIRIDKVVSEKNSEYSRVAVQRMIENGNILINGNMVKPSYKLQLNDLISINKPEVVETKIEGEDIPLDIVYEDSDILVINKQKGLVVHPGNGNLNGTLVNAVIAHCKDSLSGIGGEKRPGIVHRIDKDTTGLLIIAKNDKSHIDISEQIKNHLVKKT